MLAINLAIDEQNCVKFTGSIDHARQYLNFNVLNDLEFDDGLLAKLNDLKMNKTPNSQSSSSGVDSGQPDNPELNLLSQEEIQEELDLFYFNKSLDHNDEGTCQGSINSTSC